MMWKELHIRKMSSLAFHIRERVRFNKIVSKAIYLSQSVRYSNFGQFRAQLARVARNAPSGSGVALCCRIRDESVYLQEFVEYYLAAGVSHVWFYERDSKDDSSELVLKPYVMKGAVTHFKNWPHIPVSPSAEEDCILRAVGRYEWVGFIDADEFVVIRNGNTIDEFLAEFRGVPAVALHWRMFGSNGHIPAEPSRY